MGHFFPSSAHPTSNLFKRLIVKCHFDVSWSGFDANHQSNYTHRTQPHPVKKKNKKQKTSSLTAIFVLLTLSSFSNSNTFPKAPVRISSALRDADGWCFSCWFQKQACGWGSSQLLRRRAPGATKRWAEALALPAWPQATQTTERHQRNYCRCWLFCYNWFLLRSVWMGAW